MISTQQFYMEIRKKWKSLYPAYFDKSKTLTQGRRVPEKLSIDDPTIPELIAAISHCKVKFLVQEHKSYPKDWMNRGRIKIQLLDDDKKPANPNYKNKNQLMKAIGEKLVQARANQDKTKKK